MSDLAEFLLARIAEDEAAANHAHWAMQGEWFTTADDKVDEFVRHNSPARVLAECEAKRELIAAITAIRHEVVDGDCWFTCAAATEERDGGTCCNDDRRGGECDCGRDYRVAAFLRLLALPYVYHSDYRSEWTL